MISVIIPLYNKQSSIKETVNSVLEQTYKDFELIILNDGSTDNSLQVVQSINDTRIRIIDKQNEGVSKTRNRGVKESKSDLIFFLDADDCIYPWCIESLVELYRKYPTADAWTANYESKKKDKSKTILDSSIQGLVVSPHKLIFLKKWNFRTGSFLMTKESYSSIGGFSELMTVGEDYYFMDAYCSNYKCVYMPRVVMSYIQENRELSRGGIPCNKVIEYYLDFGNKNLWQKLSYSELVFKRLLMAMFRMDITELKTMLIKHKLWNMVGIFAIITRKPICWFNSYNKDIYKS